MVLSMQDAFAASGLPVISDVQREITKWFMIVCVKLDNHSQFYSLNWKKKKKAYGDGG